MTEKFMKAAISQAKKAEALGEAPIGAVIVKNGKIIARGYNRREKDKNALKHAEIIAIERASQKLGGWRLLGCEMYVTLEPCPMCAGALIQSRVERLYFGAYDKKAGCAGSCVDLFSANLFNHNIEVHGGIMENECACLLTDFFKALRRKPKE